MGRCFKLFKNLNLEFSDAKLEFEYTSLRKQNIMKDFQVKFTTQFYLLFQVTLGAVFLVTLSACIDRIVREDFANAAIPFAQLGILLLLYCVRKCFSKYIEYLTLAAIFTYNVYRLFLARSEYKTILKGIMFSSGYTYGILQLILISRISKMYYKFYAVVFAYLLRFGLLCWADVQILQPGLLIRNVIVDVFVLYYFYRNDKTERDIFQNFCDSREELLKFKELLTDSLPQSVTILDYQTAKTLYSNKAFSNTFPTSETDPLPSENSEGRLVQGNSPGPISLNSPMDFLFVDRTSVREMGEPQQDGMSLDFTHDSIKLHEIIKKLISKNFLNEKPLSLTASQKSQSEHRSFAIILKRVKWNKTDAVAVILNDITYQENLIALKVANVNKDKIIATISHELRTPLHGIIGLLKISETYAQEPKVLEYMSLCKDNAELLLGLVNSLLDYQQISTGKIKLNAAKINLEKTIKDVIQLFQFQTQEKQIYLQYEIEENLPICINTDENRLKQIMINLVGNAIKFTQAGGIKILVSQDVEEEKFIQISVVDTGIGIKDEDKSKLFKMYGRLENETGVNKNGVGLGLTISNALVVLLNGTRQERGIEVISRLGCGSTFYFKILKDLNTFIQTKNLPMNNNHIGTTEEAETSRLLKPTRERTGLSLRENANQKEEEEEESSQGEKHQNELLEESSMPANLGSKVSMYVSFKKVNLQELENRKKNLVHLKNKVFSSFDIREQPKNEDIPNSVVRQKSELNQGSSTPVFHQIYQKGWVVVVDDNPFNLLVAKNLLKDLGYNVKTAIGGQEAIGLIKAALKDGQKVKAIFMDCQMPIMDGYETTRILTEMMEKKEIEKIPIIGWTANNSEEDIRRCYEAGMVGYLAKPASREAILKVLC